MAETPDPEVRYGLYEEHPSGASRSWITPFASLADLHAFLAADPRGGSLLGSTPQLLRRVVREGGFADELLGPAPSPPLVHLREVAVRESQPADLSRLQEVYVASWRAAFGEVLPEERVSDAELTTRAISLGRLSVCLVAEVAGELVGFAAGDPETGQLHACYVHPGAWGLGAGTALLEAAAAALGVLRPRSEIWLEVWERNLRARALYEHAGWEREGTSRVSVVAGVEFTYLRLRPR